MNIKKPFFFFFTFFIFSIYNLSILPSKYLFIYKACSISNYFLSTLICARKGSFNSVLLSSSFYKLTYIERDCTVITLTTINYWECKSNIHLSCLVLQVHIHQYWFRLLFFDFFVSCLQANIIHNTFKYSTTVF